MIGASLRRGLTAGLIAGVLAGVFGLVVGEPTLDEAVALEAAITDEGGAQPDRPQVPRPVQKAGLVVGTVLVGLAIGAVFGVASAWAAGRLTGDAWQRSLKLGAVAVGALVLLPALAYPPNPPGAGDPDAVARRTLLFLGSGVIGLLLAGAAWSTARELARMRVPAPARQAGVGLGVLGIAAAVLAVLPGASGGADVPADLLWSFRLSAVSTQIVLFGCTAVAYGLLAVRAERRVAQPSRAS